MDFEKVISGNREVLSWLKTWSSVVEVRTWSNSDFDKIVEMLSWLTQNQVAWILRVQSAHRMPIQMMESAWSFPNIHTHDYLDKDVKRALEEKNLQVALCIACAWWSAHIAWMTASETQTPIIAYPVASSTSWQISAFYSMIDMPPGIPNWLQANQLDIVQSATRIINLRENWIKPKIWIPDAYINDKGGIAKRISEDYELTSYSQDADIWIARIDVSEESINFEWPKIKIVIPTINEKETFETMWLITKNSLNTSWLLMWRNIDGKENPQNALLYLAQLLCTIDPNNIELLNFLIEYRKWLTKSASWIDNATLSSQLM